MSTNPRLWALQEVSHRVPRVFDVPKERIADLFGANTFNEKVMISKLSKPTYRKLQETIKRGKKLDKSIADEIAHAVKEWALENGATHFCHWFQPQTGITAEKHDAFLTFNDEGQPIERFSGSQLIQSEPDASSFPSGGMRATFEARGYTAWDPSSPIFIAEEPNGKTLCIPSVFISYYGHALDNKTPLLRSMESLSNTAVKVLGLFGSKAERVVPTLGSEQEYFLVDYAYYAARPDLVAAGRTLLGAKPPKGQELEDHYFGTIKERIQAFMQEVEFELYKLGVPVKTRHNEVAPAQYETAPIFEEVNVAADHNQMTMETLRAIARRHNFALLLHEKPFARINGSGKHNNWSMMDDQGNNLLEPGKTPHENLQFLVFLVGTLKAVNTRSGLLRAAIASSGNDHRLGANEAPPAIISVFLGEQLDSILNAIEKGDSAKTGEDRVIELGVSKLPDVARDNTDRNRTSPFAFTGNKFEFRAVASSSSVSTPMAYLNAAVAEALSEIYGLIKGKLDAGVEFNKAILDVVRDVVIETKKVRFEGNGYSQEWVEEAAKRGLLNLAKTPEALAQMVLPESIEFLSKTGIYSEEEVHARYHVNVERYIKDVEIEVQALTSIVNEMIIPAAFKYQGTLAESIEALADVLEDDEVLGEQKAALKDLASSIVKLRKSVTALSHLSEKAEGLEDVGEKATFFAYEILPQMEAIRTVADYLEGIVADDVWPLPKYREMLFLSN